MSKTFAESSSGMFLSRASTLPGPAMKSGAEWLASAPQRGCRKQFLEELSENALCALPWLFEFWALPHQLPPAGDWKTWVILGGRGAGKTRAGSEWVQERRLKGGGRMSPVVPSRVALVGETFDQVRDVMVFGDSGIIACSPPDRVPQSGIRRKTAALIWPNGAMAQAFSAHEPEALRGPQFDAAWVDELAKWKKADETWSMLQFGLRLGDNPRQCVTTTPRDVADPEGSAEAGVHCRDIRPRPKPTGRTWRTASLRRFEPVMAERVLGRQELDGVLVEDTEGALWTSKGIEDGADGGVAGALTGLSWRWTRR